MFSVPNSMSLDAREHPHAITATKAAHPPPRLPTSPVSVFGGLFVLLLVRFGLFRVCVVRARHRRPTLLTHVGAHSAALMALGAARHISRTYSTALVSRTLTQRSGAVATSTGGAALPAAERGREGRGPNRSPSLPSASRHKWLTSLSRAAFEPAGAVALPVWRGAGTPSSVPRRRGLSLPHDAAAAH